MKKMYCYHCDKMVNPKREKKRNEYQIHGKKFMVEEEVFSCPFCQTEIINDTLEQDLFHIYDEYLKTYGLSFEKLKEIRKSFHLSQEMFAKVLGWSKKTITRYENAQSLPQKEYLSVYQKIDHNKMEFVKILEKRKDQLREKEYYQILDKIEIELDLKTINVFLYLLKDNYLNKTQIMKNFFALDFYCYKTLNRPLTKLKYANGSYGPIIDKKDAYLNLLIQEDFLELCFDENDNTVFKPKKEYDKNLFQEDEIKVMKMVKEKLKGKSAKKLTDWSHCFEGWKKTKRGEQIEYSYAKDFYFDGL